MSDAHLHAQEDHERIIRLTPIAPEGDSPTVSTFSHGKLLPEDLRPLASPFLEASENLALRGTMSSRSGSAAASSIFEPAVEGHDHLTEPTQATNSPDEHTNYDLKPPPPSVSHTNAESVAERLFSIDHLNLILRDPTLSSRFTTFVHRYRRSLKPLLTRYQEIQKAKSAIEYANAIAGSLSPLGPNSSPNGPAARLEAKFESRSRKAVEMLITDALPAYITHRLVQLVTECLVKEITGNNMPIMREMVQGLAEVYCMTDPSLPDNPIVYASEGMSCLQYL
jgi:hypothetical protein